MSAWWLVLIAAGGANWRGLSKSDGVTTWVLEQPGGIPRLRGQVEVDADLIEILAVLHDVGQSCSWTPDCREARLVKELDDYSSILYVRTACPWPVADRDAVIRARVTIRPDGNDARADFDSVEVPEVPPIDGVVRMQTSQGSYQLTRIGPERTRVRYEVYSDPGGNVPTGLARKALERVPHDMLLALAKRSVEMHGKYEAFRDKYDPRRKR